MAVIEFARNVLGWKEANSEEVNEKCEKKVIHLMDCQKEILEKAQYGGTIRLGSCPCKLKKGSFLKSLYGKKNIVDERHRHRYEFNNECKKDLEDAGLIISGESPDGNLVEAIEISQKEHPFFVGVQFHPELKSQFLNPHPIFMGFVKKSLERK